MFRIILPADFATKLHKLFMTFVKLYEKPAIDTASTEAKKRRYNEITAKMKNKNRIHMKITDQRFKELSINEFTAAAEKYETDEAGVYKICRKDYPEILAETKKEPFNDLLDAGCGTAPMLSLLIKEIPGKNYTGIDLTPKMIEVAKAKNLPGVKFVCGDCENLPFQPGSFDIIICSESFHHFPNPQNFLASVYKCLRPGGKLILRDTTAPYGLLWFANNVELPLLNKLGYGDVKCYHKKGIARLCENSGLTLESFEIRHVIKLHAIIRKKDLHLKSIERNCR